MKLDLTCYCVKCKEKKEVTNKGKDLPGIVFDKDNNKVRLVGYCSVCSTKMTKFLSKKVLGNLAGKLDTTQKFIPINTTEREVKLWSSKDEKSLSSKKGKIQKRQPPSAKVTTKRLVKRRK